MPRPPLPADYATATIRLDPADYDRAKLAASLCGKSLNRWAAELLASGSRLTLVSHGLPADPVAEIVPPPAAPAELAAAVELVADVARRRINPAVTAEEVAGLVAEQFDPASYAWHREAGLLETWAVEILRGVGQRIAAGVVQVAETSPPARAEEVTR